MTPQGDMHDPKKIAAFYPGKSFSLFRRDGAIAGSPAESAAGRPL